MLVADCSVHTETFWIVLTFFFRSANVSGDASTPVILQSGHRLLKYRIDIPMLLPQSRIVVGTAGICDNCR